MPAPTLTAARRSVWGAIDDHAPLADRLKSTIRYDEGAGGKPFQSRHVLDEPTAPNECPCLRIRPARTVPQWYTNVDKKFPYSLEITLFTASWDVSESEQLWSEVVAAVFASVLDGQTVPEVKRVCGDSPSLGPSGFRYLRFIDTEGKRVGPPMTEHKLTVVLQLRGNPRTTGE